MARGARTSFGPVMLVGAGSAGLLALASSRTWLHATGTAASSTQRVDVSGSDAAPLALALALVALASWGVVLVSRTRARRVALGFAALAALGVLAVVVSAGPGAHDAAARALAEHGADGVRSLSRQPAYWLTAVAAVLQLAILAVAFRAAPAWPSMSSRYDAPGGQAATVSEAVADDAPVSDLDLWKALDEGRDPTTRPSP